MDTIISSVLSVIKEGKSLVLATIIRQQGSAPRQAGTRMIIDSDGRTYGTIGGGSLEADIISQAPDLLSSGVPKRIKFELTGTDAAEDGMLCGGNVEVFLIPVSKGDETLLSVSETIESVIKTGRGGIFIESIREDPFEANRKDQTDFRWIFIGEGGEQAGDCESMDLIDHLKRLMPDILSGDNPHLLLAEELPMQKTPLFITPVMSRHRVILFGGGHICLHLAKLVKMVGFSLVVAEDRAEFITPDRFPEADELWFSSFESMLDKHQIYKNDYLIIVTRGHQHDLTVLQQALQTPACYIGMIGSRRKRDTVFRKLRERGISPERLEAVHSPIGLNIHAETPEEIAVSILAEIISVRGTKQHKKKDWKV